MERGEEEGKSKSKPRNDMQSLRMALRGKQRELEELRGEMGRVKTSIKFTVIGEWEV